MEFESLAKMVAFYKRNAFYRTVKLTCPVDNDLLRRPDLVP
jgi:hypothetical protein